MYYFTKVVSGSFNEVIKAVKIALLNEGFGVLTEIDVTKTLKSKIDVDFRPYIILGACNPTFAFKALWAEEMIGTLLPCNVVVQVNSAGNTEVTAIDPLYMMAGIQNDVLTSIATEVSEKIQRVIESL